MRDAEVDVGGEEGGGGVVEGGVGEGASGEDEDGVVLVSVGGHGCWDVWLCRGGWSGVVGKRAVRAREIRSDLMLGIRVRWSR